MYPRVRNIYSKPWPILVESHFRWHHQILLSFALLHIHSGAKKRQYLSVDRQHQILRQAVVAQLENAVAACVGCRTPRWLAAPQNKTSRVPSVTVKSSQIQMKKEKMIFFFFRVSLLHVDGVNFNNCHGSNSMIHWRSEGVLITAT